MRSLAGLSIAAEYAGQVWPEIWRRYLALILDDLRPSRTGPTALPEPALSPDEMVQAFREAAAIYSALANSTAQE